LAKKTKKIFDLEAAIVSNDKEIIRQASTWFEKHWEAAKPIDGPLLKQFEELWRKQRPKGKSLLQMFVQDPGLVASFRIRLLVIESTYSEEDENKVWEEIRHEYSDSYEDQQKIYDRMSPFYIDNANKLRPSDYIIDYWTSAQKAGSFKLRSGVGGVWRFKATKWMELNNKKTKVELFDLVKEVHGFMVSDSEWKALGECIRDHYLQTTKIGKKDILVDVPLETLPAKYPEIFKSLKERLLVPKKDAGSARAVPSNKSPLGPRLGPKRVPGRRL
jgi:hypothetical protein